MLNNLPSDETVTKQVLYYRAFLNKAWPTIDLFLEELDWDNDPYFLDHWMQTNWKLLVEHMLVGEKSIQEYSIGFNYVKKK